MFDHSHWIVMSPLTLLGTNIPLWCSDSHSEISLKICIYLTKLRRTKQSVSVFLGHPVVVVCRCSFLLFLCLSACLFIGQAAWSKGYVHIIGIVPALLSRVGLITTSDHRLTQDIQKRPLGQVNAGVNLNTATMGPSIKDVHKEGGIAKVDKMWTWGRGYLSSSGRPQT